MEEPWYRSAFRARYAQLYAHRDDEEAGRAMELLSRLAPLRGARVLDMACGQGRHVRALRDRGACAVGLDLSDDLIRTAAASGPAARGDMRGLPFLGSAFGGVVNMFTSFGYFEGRGENERVLREVARVLRPGGWFFLDYLNADSVLARLVPLGDRIVGESRIREARSFDPETRVLSKEITVSDPHGRPVDGWVEKVLLFTPEEIESMLESSRLLVRRRFGDYDGEETGPESTRLILFCERESGSS